MTYFYSILSFLGFGWSNWTVHSKIDGKYRGHLYSRKNELTGLTEYKKIVEPQEYGWSKWKKIGTVQVADWEFSDNGCIHNNYSLLESVNEYTGEVKHMRVKI